MSAQKPKSSKHEHKQAHEAHQEWIEATGMSDPVAFGKILMDVAERVQPLLTDIVTKMDLNDSAFSFDPMNMQDAYVRFMETLWSDPQKLAEMQMQYWNNWMSLWQESAKRLNGEPSKTLYEPQKGDRRFQSPLWSENPVFDFIKQSYLLTAQWSDKVVGNTEGLDDATRQKMAFMTKQYINAVAPTNFLMTNPEVIQETIDSKGENLVRGLENLIEDLERGHGMLRISTTNYDSFHLGENIATTKGSVVYQNDLMQLIQYQPQTKEVFKRPLLVIPPWINKFYILDLREENSYISWLVAQGHTVFVISWVNPDRELAKKKFEDYMEEGIFDALNRIRDITGEPDANVISYCLGGTLTAATLGWLAAQKKASRIASATFLTTLIDFKDAGDMKIFMDDAQIEMLTKKMDAKGVLDASQMRQTFSLLRANDMIWSFVVNNYLMGREPFPFDLLYWNDDATNMPAAMHHFYLQKFYCDNLLIEKNGMTLNDVDIDMGTVETPCYFLSAREDHIAPWEATYAGTQLLKGPCQFTLAASGHVGGVVNPPHKNKYCHWVNDKNPQTPNEWLESAQSHDGSWWPHWQKWAEEFTNGKVKARKPGSEKYKPIEDAPGSYVKMKSD